MAVRAAAERGDRAAMLGINVGRVQTIVWTIASLLAFLALFLRTGAVGLPIGSPSGPAFLIQAIGAAVIGRFERFPTIACASIAIGILDQANTFQPGNRPSFNDVMIFVIVLVALLFVRRPTHDPRRRRQQLADRRRGPAGPGRARPAARGPRRSSGASARWCSRSCSWSRRSSPRPSSASRP